MARLKKISIFKKYLKKESLFNIKMLFTTCNLAKWYSSKLLTKIYKKSYEKKLTFWYIISTIFVISEICKIYNLAVS